MFFKKVLNIRYENMPDEKPINLEIERLLSKIKTSRTEYEQIKKL